MVATPRPSVCLRTLPNPTRWPSVWSAAPKRWSPLAAVGAWQNSRAASIEIGPWIRRRVRVTWALAYSDSTKVASPPSSLRRLSRSDRSATAGLTRCRPNGQPQPRRPPASTSAASFASAIRQPASLSAGDTPGGSPSCTASRLVPPAPSASVIVIVISPRSAGSTICSFGTSFTKRPWYVSVRAVVLPTLVGASYVREIRNKPANCHGARGVTVTRPRGRTGAGLDSARSLARRCARRGQQPRCPRTPGPK